jgi:hypothetical protein
MLFFDKPFLQIDYDHFLYCLINTWKGYFLSSEYREAMDKLIDTLLQTGAKTMIINLAQVRQEEIYDVHWTHADWLPRVFETEIQKIAIILSPTSSTQVPRQETALSIDSQIVALRYFDSLIEAKEWIYRN